MNTLRKLTLGAGALLLLAGCSTTPAAKTPTDASASEGKEKAAVSAAIPNQATTPHYDVVKRDEAATIDGKIDEDVWSSVQNISGSFFYPWADKEAPVTVFEAYNDGTDLYFMFEVTDPEVLVEEDWKDDESIVDAEDRVEIFLAQGPVDLPTPKGMPLYYGVEIDPKGRVHDYSIEYYRHFDGTWNLEGLETAGVQTDDGYVVEGKVPLSTLKDLNLLKEDGTMRTGVYRAEFSSPEKEGDDTVMEWISWVDPKTEEPDYHVDSSFGEFRILK